MKRTVKKILIGFVILLSASTLFANEWEKVVNLRGYWKFTIGDDMKWAEPNYPDNNWEKIKVPASWESQGFHGYNGYAWYRTDLKVNGNLRPVIILIRKMRTTKTMTGKTFLSRVIGSRKDGMNTMDSDGTG